VVPEAPIDGELYGRQDTDWRPIVYPNGLPPDGDIGDQLLKQGLDDGDAAWMPSAVPPPVLPALEFHLGRSTTSLPMARGRKIDQDIHLARYGHAAWILGHVPSRLVDASWHCGGTVWRMELRGFVCRFWRRRSACTSRSERRT
jgi:hypothetical protein